jgi:hypothetical protein
MPYFFDIAEFSYPKKRKVTEEDKSPKDQHKKGET